MKRFEKHIFICENKRDTNNPKTSCGVKGGDKFKQLFKDKLKAKGILADFRPNSCGCLAACEYGPVIVIYPEQVWYGNITENDIDEIIEEHLLNNKIVERLTIKDDRFNKDAK
ncbi:MAG TPA: (2Fe-2S) ferredoxin domain-containing protein [Melioribacteraceae bacterium]|nr:(2Fe-2S) ferredoxin domain-containing protein [Melioribacteraceae bacterium]